jgi:hypothetical protein
MQQLLVTCWTTDTRMVRYITVYTLLSTLSDVALSPSVARRGLLRCPIVTPEGGSVGCGSVRLTHAPSLRLSVSRAGMPVFCHPANLPFVSREQQTNQAEIQIRHTRPLALQVGQPESARPVHYAAGSQWWRNQWSLPLTVLVPGPPLRLLVYPTLTPRL